MVLVYSKQNCPQCVAAKTKLTAAGIKYEEIRVDLDPSARNMLMGFGHRSVPVIYKDGAAIKLEDLLLQVK